MNRTDLFCSTVTQMIEPRDLAAFTAMVVDRGPIEAAPIIIDAHHEHVLTTRYELTPTEDGVIGRTQSGVATMTWTAIATILARTATPERAHALNDAATAHERGRNGASTGVVVSKVIDAYAHAAATAAGLIDAPTHRRFDHGYDIALRSTRHRTTLSVNGTDLVQIRPLQFHADVDVLAHLEPTTNQAAPQQSATIMFVPPAASNSPVPDHASERISIAARHPDDERSFGWVIQIDGYDTITVDPVPDRGIRIAVYDNDPRQPHLRVDVTAHVPPNNAPTRQRSSSNTPPNGRCL